MICTCDNCHYTFDSPALPSRCPDCGKETRSHKAGMRIVTVPCVRRATEDEIAWYEKIQQEFADEEAAAAANAAFAEKLKMLGAPNFREKWRSKDETVEDEDTDEEEEENVWELSYPPDPYNMSVHEHNFALMLLHYLHILGCYGKQDLQKMIMTTDIAEKVELFKNVKKVFNREINKEEWSIKKPRRLDYETWESATPARKTLYSFRQDDDFKILFRDLPNRGNSKRIDPQQLAENPSEGFTRFLTELYNGSVEQRK